MKKVSVIIPMYNAEPYLAQCLQSVFDQSWQDWEILVIDDGSTDGSLTLCRQLCAENDRVQILHQENRGVSAARNRGLEAASGKYLFFLDSDDAIHPRLLEELLRQAETCQAELAFCDVIKVDDGQLTECMRQAPLLQNQWTIIGREESEAWNTAQGKLAGIGGKMILREFLGPLRFHEELSQGEDTLLLHYLAQKQVRIAYLQQDCYYYRIRPTSLTRSYNADVEQHFDAYYIIRDDELRRGRTAAALTWERKLVWSLMDRYKPARKAQNRKASRSIKRAAFSEFKHPLFREIPRSMRWTVLCCFLCYPLYAFLRQATLRRQKRWEQIQQMRQKKQKIQQRNQKMRQEKRKIQQRNQKMRRLAMPLLKIRWWIWSRMGLVRPDTDTGILTFHCSDNFGAMLQAYGLKAYLCRRGVKTDIVRYEPPFLTGRHWLIPYAPFTGKKWLAQRIGYTWQGWKRHRAMGADFSQQRKNMRWFREQYLAGKDQRRALFRWQLRWHPYRFYIVGSDQIWNPDITMGLRPVYFGAFKSRRKQRVIAYAASLGSAALPPRYDQSFASLLRNVNAISLREESAVPYVERLRGAPVSAVPDPVFFLKQKDWQQLERLPDRRGYILLYATEGDENLRSYARELSREKNLPVVELKYTKWKPAEEFQVDYTAGPAEFLGYIHMADYVVTNSFHAAAFSIIFQKRFLVFLHSTLGARLWNVLQLHGLEDRLYQDGADIDAPIDWRSVRRRTAESVQSAGAYLLKNLTP